MSSKWFKQLEKELETQDLPKLSVSEVTFSSNYQEDFAVSDALVDLAALATVKKDQSIQARLLKINRAPTEFSV